MSTHSIIIAAISTYLLASVGPTVINWLNVNGLLYVHTPFPILVFLMFLCLISAYSSGPQGTTYPAVEDLPKPISAGSDSGVGDGGGGVVGVSVDEGGGKDEEIFQGGESQDGTNSE